MDDEEAIRRITGQTLESFGYRALVAKDGADALGMFRQHKDEIAVVLTDMMMPIMDGLTAIQSLKAIDPDVRIIAASGVKTETQRTKASDAGAKHFLAKPYTAKAMLRILDELLHSPHHSPSVELS